MANGYIFGINIRTILKILGRCEFLRFGIRDRIIRLFHDPDTATQEKFKIPFFGMSYSGEFSTFLDWSVFYYGAYAKEELKLIRDFSEICNGTFIDVGANVGQHTIFASKIFNRVVSFEPYKKVLEKLEEKIKLNDIKNIITVPVGLGAYDRTASFNPPDTNNTGVGSFAKEASVGSIELPVKRGDSILEELKIDSIVFIKMDIEGFEPSAPAGLIKTMRRDRPIIFFEWTQNELKNDISSHSELFPDNYKFYEFVSDVNVWLVFRRKKYVLKELKDYWCDGNIVAIPGELHGSLIH